MSRRALVVAITRLGDLIQTEPMLRALRSSGQVDHVTVLVERSFCDVARLLSGADEVHVIDFETILRPLDSRSGSLPIRAFLEIDEWLREQHFECVINVTHSRPSMLLTALAGENAYGVTMDPDGSQVAYNAWLQYFFATNLARPWCAVNLVDIYVNAVAPQTPVRQRVPILKRESARRKRASRWEEMSVLMHAGASQSDKQWPLERFVELSRELLRRGATVTLVGAGKGDIASAFPSHAKLRSLIGRTTVEELIALCEESDLLVSADSGPVHVAATTNLPTVVIEGGSAHGFETAPYMEDAYVIQPHLPNVVARIPGKKVTSGQAARVSVETVMSSIDHLLGDVVSVKASSGCTVYRTAFGDEPAGLKLEPLSNSHEEFELWQQLLRGFWYTALNRDTTSSADTDNDLRRLFENCRSACVAIEECGNNLRLLESGAKRLAVTEQSLTIRLNQTAPLHHVNAFLQIARSSVPGKAPTDQARSLACVYEGLTRAAGHLTPVLTTNKETLNNCLAEPEELK